MNTALYAAASLTVLISLAHSYLGEKYILIRLFRRDNLPRLFGGSAFTKATLRFAWHITSVAWCGLAAILVAMAHPPVESATLGAIVGVTFLVHGAIALVASRGRHLSWVVFLIIGILSIYATRS